MRKQKVSRLFYDIETDGLLDKCSRIHSLCIIDDKGNEFSFTDNGEYARIATGIDMLREADEVLGHNLLQFDNEVIRRLYDLDLDSKTTDTLVMSELAHHDIYESTRRFWKHTPKSLWFQHGLKAWGYRLGFHKGTFGEDTDWSTWSNEMQEYCMQDVKLNIEVYKHLMTQNIPVKAIKAECEFRSVAMEQEMNGVPFNAEEAKRLFDEVQADVDVLHKELTDLIPSWVEEVKFTPKINNSKRGYVKGVETIKRIVKPFNPGSRDQIIKYLNQKYRWQSPERTKGGKQKLSEDILRNLPYPEADKFADYLVKKSLAGKIGTAKGAWLKCTKDGRIHGSMKTLGAQSHRCIHAQPNLSQVPSPKKYRGEECRSLFEAPEGYKFVGADASGIQLRMLGHFLFPYDNGAYAHEVVNGDVHTKNRKDAGLNSRDSAKTFIYSLLFGAGGALLGQLLSPKKPEAYQKRVGDQAKNRFMARNPELAMLLRDVTHAFNTKGWVKGLDGRRLVPSSSHTALNTIIQNAESILMKRACVLAREYIRKEKLDAKQVLFIHDEYNFIVKDGDEQRVAEILESCIEEASKELKFNVKNEGEAKIGNTWMEVH